jgi:hypothetical protein
VQIESITGMLGIKGGSAKQIRSRVPFSLSAHAGFALSNKYHSALSSTAADAESGIAVSNLD